MHGDDEEERRPIATKKYRGTIYESLMVGSKDNIRDDEEVLGENEEEDDETAIIGAADQPEFEKPDFVLHEDPPAH
jgi:hypothetical protein